MNSEIEQIWKKFNRELKAFIRHKTGNTDDTEDILQDTFIKIISNWDKVQGAENLRHYIFGIVRNTLYDHFRKKQAGTDALSVLEPMTEEESTSLNATIADCCIRPFILRLPLPYREALQITEFQNISQKELAERLGISYSGAKSRIQRGKVKLKELLLACCHYESDVYGNIISEGESDCACA